MRIGRSAVTGNLWTMRRGVDELEARRDGCTNIALMTPEHKTCEHDREHDV